MRFLKNSFSSPAILLACVTIGVLCAVPFGPLAYPGQPSTSVLIATATGLTLFAAGQLMGSRLGHIFLARISDLRADPSQLLNMVVTASAVLGLFGIGCIVLDREVLSGINNADASTAFAALN